jgi:CheY-like chemotaxis protein
MSTFDSSVLPGRGSTALVAEDEALVRRVLEEMLKRLGFQVFSAADGAEALRAVEELSDAIDLVIFDMAMPVMSGQELFSELRRRLPSARTVLASGAGMEDDEICAMREDGLDGFLAKPFSISQIRQEITRVMSATGEA